MGEIETFILLAFIIAILIRISSLKKQLLEINKKINILLQKEKLQKSDEAIVANEESEEHHKIVSDQLIVQTEKIIKEEHTGLDTQVYKQGSSAETETPEVKTPPVFSKPLYSIPPIPGSLRVVDPVAKPLTETMGEIKTPPIPHTVEKRNMIERLLGDNWLSKIGIITLVLGIAFFVKYAIDQDWINEVGRVGIGLLTGALIIGIAHKLKIKYKVFSSILVGGGIAVFYITITLAFREYELFGQTVAFILLIITTVFSVILSLLYDRKELAVLSLLGGFASPLLASTGTGNYIVLFSYLLILNAGMLVISFIKQWRLIGIISYLLTLLFFWSWMFNSYDNQFWSVALFTSLFFIQFYVLAIIDHFKAGKKISAYQAFLILSNNLLTFLAYLFIFEDHWNDLRGLITLTLAMTNMIVLLSLFRNSRIDRNMIYMLIAIVLSFVSLAIPIQLNGHVITLFWVTESVLLLWLWQKSRINVFNVGFVFITVLTLISYIMDIDNNYNYYKILQPVFNRLFITGTVIIIGFTINLFLLKKDKVHLNENIQLIKFFKLLVIILAYMVPVIEMNYQLTLYTDINLYSISSFRIVVLATYTIFYIAALGFIFKKSLSSRKYIYGLLYMSAIIYSTLYSFIIAVFRFHIFKAYEFTYPEFYFSVHLLSLPLFAYIIFLLVRNIKSFPPKTSTLLSWVLTVLVVIVASVETDNMVIWLLGNRSNYGELLYDVHTFVYPILWGIIAMILMIWGLNRKVALLRKIALVFFIVIIVKFYAYDVWHMSQAGRIISFVVLGVILLLVSFLQQKIRTLVKDEKIETENNNIGK